MQVAKLHPNQLTMYLWRRRATPQWWLNHEESLRARFGRKLAVIERPNRTQLQIEVICNSRTLANQFGGRIEKLPRDWLKRFLRQQKTRPVRVGNRQLLIPAGAAFGTGEHATTILSLLLLGKFSRKMKTDWSLLDLGTGSGILALAAKSLGAKRVIGVDVDPFAISTARQNARRNKIGHVQFQVADVRCWKFPSKIDLVTANLFSELLIEVLPKLKRSRWLILSGILREQENELLRALNCHQIEIVELRRRGKWIALLAATN
jgi:ribosomal protein L11 methyltransferase